MSLGQKRVVVVGGGSGVRALITGLVRHDVYPIGLCSVFDNGGSTGRLRDEFGNMLPSGDVRNVFEALIPPELDFLRSLFGHRFKGNGTEVSEHNLGNLLFLAAEKIMQDPIAGIRKLGGLCCIRGEVLPISLDNANLRAMLSDGSIVEGETAIDLRGANNLTDERTITRVTLLPNAFVCREAADALRSADVVVLGPGDLFTSIIPNLLVQGVPEILNECKGTLVFVCNLMTKWGETQNYTAATFVNTLYEYGLSRPLDAVVCNGQSVPKGVYEKYRQNERAEQVVVEQNMQDASDHVRRLVYANLLSPEGLARGLVRHMPEELARTILSL